MARIVELLHEGDWACAFRQPTRLARTCRALAKLVDEPDASLLRRAADRAGCDLEETRRIWVYVAGSLRRHDLWSRPPEL